MGGSHLIDYFVITAADVTAVFLAWLAGRGWLERKAKQISSVNWQRSGHLYWLSSDLMWTWTQATNGNVQRLIHGLKKSGYHANALGIDDSILSRLKAMQVANEAKPSLSPSERQALAQELDSIISEVGRLAVGNQPDFRADP
jgi:hypothetical protein